MDDRHYRLKYDLKLEYAPEGGFDKAEIIAEGKGGADALVLVSIVRDGNNPHEGWKSIKVTEIDGRGQDFHVPDTELFQVITATADGLLERFIQGVDNPITNWEREILADLMTTVRNKLQELKGNHAAN